MQGFSYRCPAKEIGKQRRTDIGRALWMELHAGNAAAFNAGGERLAMRATGNAVVGDRRGIAMHEVGMRRLTDAFQQCRFAKDVQRIPAHMRHPQTGAARHPAYRAREQAETRDITLFARIKQQLHAQADTHQWHFKCSQCDIQAALAQQLHRQRCRTYTGQYDPLRALQAISIAHDAWVHAKPLQCITHRTQICTAGIDQGNVIRLLVFHNMPLVLGNSLPSRRNA